MRARVHLRFNVFEAAIPHLSALPTHSFLTLSAALCQHADECCLLPLPSSFLCGYIRASAAAFDTVIWKDARTSCCVCVCVKLFWQCCSRQLIIWSAVRVRARITHVPTEWAGITRRLSYEESASGEFLTLAAPTAAARGWVIIMGDSAPSSTAAVQQDWYYGGRYNNGEQLLIRKTYIEHQYRWKADRQASLAKHMGLQAKSMRFRVLELDSPPQCYRLYNSCCTTQFRLSAIGLIPKRIIGLHNFFRSYSKLHKYSQDLRCKLWTCH